VGVETNVPLESGSQERRNEDAAIQELTRKKFQLLVQQQMNKREIERTIQALRQARGEVGLEEQKQLSPDELRAIAKDAERGTDLLAKRTVLTAYAYTAPIAMQGQQLYEKVNDRLKETQKKAAELAVEEMKALGNELTESLHMEFVPEHFRELSKMEIPKMSLMIACAIAPTQLQALYMTNKAILILRVILLFVCGFCLTLDFRSQADVSPVTASVLPDAWRIRNEVYGWHIVDFIVGSFVVAIRLELMRELSNTLSEIEKPEDEPVAAENAYEALVALTTFYSKSGGNALLTVDAVSKSRLYKIAAFWAVFDFAWLMVGTDITVNTPWSKCPEMSLFHLRLRVVLFLIALIPYVLYVILIAFSDDLNSSSMNESILGFADGIDQTSGLNYPVCRVLAQATLVRDASDMINLELRVREQRKLRLKKDKATAESSLADIEREQQNIESEIDDLRKKKSESAENSSKENFLQEHEEAQRQLLESSEQAFRETNKKIREVADMAMAASPQYVDAMQAATVKATEVVGDVAVRAADHAADGAMQAVAAAHQAAAELQEEVEGRTSAGTALLSPPQA
jgi:hypothetical protein